MLVYDKDARQYEKLYKGPYTIMKVWKNETVTINWGAIQVPPSQLVFGRDMILSTQIIYEW